MTKMVLSRELMSIYLPPQCNSEVDVSNGSLCKLDCAPSQLCC